MHGIKVGPMFLPFGEKTSISLVVHLFPLKAFIHSLILNQLDLQPLYEAVQYSFVHTAYMYTLNSKDVPENESFAGFRSTSCKFSCYSNFFWLNGKLQTCTKSSIPPPAALELVKAWLHRSQFRPF